MIYVSVTCSDCDKLIRFSGTLDASELDSKLREEGWKVDSIEEELVFCTNPNCGTIDRIEDWKE